MMIAENIKSFRMNNKKMANVTFSISFVKVKVIIANKFFKKACIDIRPERAIWQIRNWKLYKSLKHLLK